MSKKNETLCDWSRKKIEKQFAELTAIVAQPKFICKKCGRASSEKKRLCKPAAI